MSGPKPAPTRPGGRSGPGQKGPGGRPNGAGRTKPGAPRPAHEARLRLFYALPLPEDVTAELVRAQSPLTANWRRVPPEQFHLTLAYLPGVPGERVRELEQAGRELAARFPPLTLRLRGTGYHPNAGGPRVWFVKVEGEGLRELAGALDALLRERGFAPEGDFQPHVTLARKKGPAPRVPPRSFAAEWVAPGLKLVHTFLPKDKSGPVHDTVNRFRLSGAALPAAPTPSSTPQSTDTPGDRPDEEHHG